MRRRTLHLLAALALVASAGLAGCGGDDDGADVRDLGGTTETGTGTGSGTGSGTGTGTGSGTETGETTTSP